MKLEGSNGQLALIGATPDTNWWYDEWLEDPAGGLDETPRRAKLPGVSGTGEDWGIGWKRMKWVKIWAGWSQPGGVWEGDLDRAGWNGTVGVAGTGMWGIDEIIVRRRCD